jgi:hypothetical protein
MIAKPDSYDPKKRAKNCSGNLCATVLPVKCHRPGYPTPLRRSSLQAATQRDVLKASNTPVAENVAAMEEKV